MAHNSNDELRARQKKLNAIRGAGVNPYPEKFKKTHSLMEAKASAGGAKVKVAGRIMTMRDMGKLCFCHLLDNSGKMQIALKSDDIGQEQYDFFVKNFDLGDFLGLEGEIFTTHKGEISILVKNYQMLAKALRPLPEKWHGLQDEELKYRERYLDLIMNPDTKDRFLKRSAIVKNIREFLEARDFIEVETPVLMTKASGAIAKPFITHHHALDLDVYLRIAPETYLKRAIVGGFEKVFEFARCFRNEGMDPSHLQDFTMLEFYQAYANFEDLMRLTEELMRELIMKTFGASEIEIIGRGGNKRMIDFGQEWQVATFRDLIIKDADIDIDEFAAADKLLKEIKKKKIKIDIANPEKASRGKLIDELYKTVSRPKIYGPLFLIFHPIDLSPLARKNDANPEIADRFQLVVNGWEIVNAYSELVDPIDQRQRFEEQLKAKEAGDEEAMEIDEDYLRAMEHGMPPIAGWGMGIDRLVTILTGQDNLKDSVLFPLMKPEKNPSLISEKNLEKEVEEEISNIIKETIKKHLKN
jgi:lysyl-tRNA synthetase class 2